MAGALARKLDSIQEQGGVRGTDVAKLLDTTPQTLSRWRSGKVRPQSEKETRLLTLEWLIAELAQFYEPDEARLWLLSPHRLLGGDTPAERIHDGRVEGSRPSSHNSKTARSSSLNPRRVQRLWHRDK